MKAMMLFIITASLSSCTKKSWQGILYPNGCLTCDSSHIYSPSFKSFTDCKSWAESKMKNGVDKASCGRSCEYNGAMDMSKCDIVVRSWIIPILPNNPNFNTYKE